MDLQRAGPGAEVLDVAGRTNTRARRINDTGHTNNKDDVSQNGSDKLHEDYEAPRR